MALNKRTIQVFGADGKEIELKCNDCGEEMEVFETLSGVYAACVFRCTDGTLDEKEEEIEGLKEEIELKDIDLDERDSDIYELQDKVEGLEDELDEKKGEVDDARIEIARLNAYIQELIADVEWYKEAGKNPNVEVKTSWRVKTDAK